MNERRRCFCHFVTPLNRSGFVAQHREHVVEGSAAGGLDAFDREGLATAMIGERVKAGGETMEVVRIRITDAGRKALEGDAP